MPDDTQRPPVSHPVKDIVLPLTVVVGLVVNAFFMGNVWGKISYRMDIMDFTLSEEKAKNSEQDKHLQALRDRTHDLERDNKDQDRRFLLLDDYTRGRIDRMPYKPPPPAKW